MIVLSGLFSRQMTSEMIADIKTENTTDTETMIAIKGFPVICFTIDSWDSSNFKTLSKIKIILTKEFTFTICFSLPFKKSDYLGFVCLVNKIYVRLKVSHPVVKLQTDSAHSHSF